MAPRANSSSGAKIQIALTLSLSNLIKIQRIVETEKTSLSSACQKLLMEALDRIPDEKAKK
jgi:hypothetical protein